MIEEIRDVFATFHDGTITEYKGNLKKLDLKIECEYLAKQFDESFENFYLTISEIEFIELEPWMNPKELEPRYFKELNKIFNAELEIGYAKIEENTVIITCNQHNLKYNYCGGYLKIKAKKIEVRNHLDELIKPEELYRNSEEYWDKLNKEI